MCARLYGKRSAKNRAKKAMDVLSDHVFSYQTRLAQDGVRERALDRYAQLVGHIERRLFAKRSGGGSAIACKNEFLNSIRHAF